jgi:hypothetical protein
MSRRIEAERQRGLLSALRHADCGLPVAAVALPAAGRLAGLRAYRANAQAIAQRALNAAYPTVARLLGDEPMRALARDLWRAHPPLRGDLAWFGAELGGWIAGVAELAEWPWLADVARLDWALHRAQFAADPPDLPVGLPLLAETDPGQLAVVFVPGSACIDSAWSLHAIWAAQTRETGEPPDLRTAETAWVWRRGHRACVATLGPGDSTLHQALLAGNALGVAWESASSGDPDFDFSAWLTRALREGWLAGIHPLPS